MMMVTGLVIALMLVLALVFVVPPLLRPPRAPGVDRAGLNVELHRVRLAELQADRAAGTLDQAQFEQARQDLERELLGDIDSTAPATASHAQGRHLALALSVLLPIVALGLYFQFGGWRGLDGQPPVAAHAESMMPAESGQTPQALPSVEEMLTRLEARLAQEPGDIEGWLMLGRSYVYLNRYPEAIQAYDKVLALSDTPSPELQAEYAEVKGMAGDGESVVAAAGASIEVSVSLDPALQARIAPTDTLFVFARAESGPPMPLAIVRATAGDLPGMFTLDDSQAMMPTMKLSSFPRVVVGARVSKSGNAMPASGDLQGLSAAVEPATAGKLSITISEVLP